MKRLIAFMILAVLLALLVPATLPASFADREIRVFLNGTRIAFDQPPVLQQDRTLVPVRQICEGLGADVEWDAEHKAVTVRRGTDCIRLQIGRRTATVNGSAVPLDTAPVLYNGRTMLPLRFVAETLGASVAWNGGTQTASVSYQPQPLQLLVQTADGSKALTDVIQNGDGTWSAPAVQVLETLGVQETNIRQAAEKMGYEQYGNQIRPIRNFDGTLTAGALSARYSDAFFENPSDQYAPGLAQASLLFAAAAFTAADSAASYGEDGWCGREAELERVFQAAGFRNAEFFGYDRSLNDSGDQAAFGIAEKSILAHGKAEKLVAVAVRGGGYGCEWVSNMHVSVLLPWHMGFGAAAQQVYEELQDYLKRHQLEDPLLWITGFSRGAAVANLTAGLLNENGFDAGRLYAYTFATPNCTTVPAYTNIFNIVGDADAVADIPLRQWGFSKHGVTKTFTDTQAHSADNIAQKNALIGALERAVPQREIYCSSLQAVLMGYMQCANTRFLNESGVWEQKSLTDTFAALYGEEGKQALALARQNSLLRILQRTAPAVSEYVTVVIALCLANECEITSSITSLLIDPAVHQLLFNSGLVTKAHDPAVYMQALEHIR